MRTALESGTAVARRRWSLAKQESAERAFAPVKHTPLSEWIEEHGMLPEGDAEPGPYRLSRVPYLREILDEISNPERERIVIMKGTQLGLTVATTLALLYFIEHRPQRMLQVLPTEPFAKKWSREKLAPVLDSMPHVSALISESRSRDSANTVLSKTFNGGFLNVVGANSPTGLRSTSAPFANLDEVDGFPPSAGSEGDPVRLVEKRLQTYHWRKVIANSTPTLKGGSRIERMFDNSDQRHLYVPCTHCGHFQILRWGGPNDDFGFKWEKKEVDGKLVADPETVAYLCESCHSLIDESEKPAMVRAHEWRAHNPGHPTAGFHLPSLYSLFPGAGWPKLVEQWVEAGEDPHELKVFVNTILAETWEDRGQKLGTDELASRAEAYIGVDGQPCEVPTGVGVLTASVDVQDDRLELLVQGWGEGEESWVIAHHRIYGDPLKGGTWARLEALRVKPYLHARGGTMRIQCTMVDSGHLKDAVYSYVRPRERQNVFASKGATSAEAEPVSRATRKTNDGVTLFTLGTVALKEILFRRLTIQRPGPGRYHFPEPGPDGADAEFYAQFGAEKRVRRRKKGSMKLVTEYVQVRRRNESIDLCCGNLGALRALGMGVRLNLGALAEKAGFKKGQTRRRTRVLSKGVE